MKAFVRSFYLLLFAVPAALLLIGLPKKSTNEDSAPAAPVAMVTNVDGTWKLVKYGIELHTPQNWVMKAQKHRDILCADAAAPQDACISVISLPNLFRKSLLQLEQENIQAIGDAKTITIDKSSRVRIADRVEGLRFDYHGTQLGSTDEMHYVCLLWINGGQQVIVTAQVKSARWSELGSQVEDALSSLKFSAN